MAEAKTTTKKPATKSAKAAVAHKAINKKKTLVVKPGDVKGTRTGVVESDKRSETRTVVVNYMSKHPKYGKYIRNRTVLQVHDASNDSKLGDIVEVAPCRPVSKTKVWRLVKVVERRSAQAAALASAKALGT
jgi:small subunit ribosomal protein S17